MNSDEYKRRVIALLKSGDMKALEEAAECVLQVSENSGCDYIDSMCYDDDDY